MNIRREIDRRLAAALRSAGAPEDCLALVTPATRAEFGDYQANGAMAAAKKLKANPRQFAEKILAVLDLSDLAEPPTIAGPGFINIRLKNDAIASRLSAVVDRLGVDLPAKPQTVVVDYSSPNLAKEMHAGHLRSTIIGDALARILGFLGDNVIRQNHVGDWGTQFGMLVAYLDVLGRSAVEHINDLEAYYRDAKKRFDEDPAFAQMAREYVVKLQGGDAAVRSSWERFLAMSMEHCAEVYRKLDVLLTPADIRGESAYNDDLPKVVEDLSRLGLLASSQGAKGVFLPEFKNKEGEAAFIIVEKSGGGYLYATTDLAAIRYRCGVLQADRILYVTDSRQDQHFKQVFTVARKAGFVPPGVSLEHIGFGMMLGSDNRPFKTREGGTVKLMDLLDEAERRALELVKAKAAERGEQLSEEQYRLIAHAVGVGAVKYADLSQNRTSDYVFSYDKMLSLEGNTAPYMQYAYARVRSIFRKGATSTNCAESQPGIQVTEPAERTLGLKLLQFPETIDTAAAECLPNLLCGYLYDLAGAFMSFYEACPVLKAESEAIRTSRLALCDLTARTIHTGLGLLGIQTIEQM